MLITLQHLVFYKPRSVPRVLAPQACLVLHSQVDADSRRRGPLASRVHRGFFASWHRNGLNQRVLAHVRDIISSRKDAGAAGLRVIVTGAHLLLSRRSQDAYALVLATDQHRDNMFLP